jgi:hypothetical protein
MGAALENKASNCIRGRLSRFRGTRKLRKSLNRKFIDCNHRRGVHTRVIFNRSFGRQAFHPHRRARDYRQEVGSY